MNQYQRALIFRRAWAYAQPLPDSSSISESRAVGRSRWQTTPVLERCFQPVVCVDAILELTCDAVRMRLVMPSGWT